MNNRQLAVNFLARLISVTEADVDTLEALFDMVEQREDPAPTWAMLALPDDARVVEFACDEPTVRVTTTQATP